MAGKSTEPKWLSPSEMAAWRRYIVASRRLLDALDADLDSEDLSMADYEVLVLLSEAPDRRMRMSELAENGLVSRSRLSHRMKVMEKAGWVKRQNCEVDKRGQWAVMTPKGWQAIVKAAPIHLNSIRKRFIDVLSKGDQEAIAQAFNKIENNLRKEIIE